MYSLYIYWFKFLWFWRKYSSLFSHRQGECSLLLSDVPYLLLPSRLSSCPCPGFPHRPSQHLLDSSEVSLWLASSELSAHGNHLGEDAGTSQVFHRVWNQAITWLNMVLLVLFPQLFFPSSSPEPCVPGQSSPVLLLWFVLLAHSKWVCSLPWVA